MKNTIHDNWGGMTADARQGKSRHRCKFLDWIITRTTPALQTPTLQRALGKTSWKHLVKKQKMGWMCIPQRIEKIDLKQKQVWDKTGNLYSSRNFPCHRREPPTFTLGEKPSSSIPLMEDYQICAARWRSKIIFGAGWRVHRLKFRIFNQIGSRLDAFPVTALGQKFSQKDLSDFLLNISAKRYQILLGSLRNQFRKQQKVIRQSDTHKSTQSSDRGCWHQINAFLAVAGV